MALLGESVPRVREPREPVAKEVRVVRLDEERSAALLLESTDGLRDRYPHLCADQTLTVRQIKGLVAAAAVVAVCIAFAPKTTLIAFTAATTVLYTLAMGYRTLLYRRTVDEASLVQVSDEEARAIPDADLPSYTILVPAYREPEVINALLNSIDALEYPRDRLDVKLLLEENDPETLAAVRAATAGPHVEVVIVPPAHPQTKPKACNFGLQLSSADYVTIYDAEDRPEPLQLRRAVVAFLRLGPRFSCLQARLGYFNGPQNAITKWFDGEYLGWFRHLLPGLVSLGAPVPLGGTSNHIRRTALSAVGAWDPFNVTEDADLGIRLQRSGYQIAVIDSVTLEEANSDFVNWAKQRSRWYKGYMQTWLVHMRHPLDLWRSLGFRGFVGFNLFIGGTPLLALLNPIFWLLTLTYLFTRSDFIISIFPAVVYYPALACFWLGNALVIYTGVLTVRTSGRGDLLRAALIAPFYWLMMSMAAVKAFIQLVQEPFYWEKTQHGLAGAKHEVTGASA